MAFVLVILAFSAPGTLIFAGLASIPVTLLCSRAILRRRWHAALAQTVFMLVLPVWMIWRERVGQQACLASGHVCDDLGGVFIELACWVAIFAALGLGPWLGLRLFKRFGESDGTPQ